MIWIKALFHCIKNKKQKLTFEKEKIEWRAKNKNNGTLYHSRFDQSIVEVGNASYGELNVVSFGKNHKLKIGNYVSIAQEVVFLLDVEHRLDCISTYPFKVKSLKQVQYEAYGKGNIIIEDDVWIGYGATILSGVTIGRGAVVAARSVVTHDVPEYTIVGGNPASVIRGRFNPDVSNRLKTIDFGKLDKKAIEKNIELFYDRVTDENIDDIIEKLGLKDE